jgi:hypothetical protein
MNNLILYTTEDGRTAIQLRANNQTVWLTQREMAQLFAVSTDNIGMHLKNIFADAELDADSVTEESSVTAVDGKNYQTKLYNLDAILAVGYRVRSPRGAQFRRAHREGEQQARILQDPQVGVDAGVVSRSVIVKMKVYECLKPQ